MYISFDLVLRVLFITKGRAPAGNMFPFDVMKLSFVIMKAAVSLTVHAGFVNSCLIEVLFGVKLKGLWVKFWAGADHVTPARRAVL